MNNQTNTNNNNTTMMTNVNIEELKKLFDFTKYGSKVRFFRMIGEQPKEGENYDTWMSRCNRKYFEETKRKQIICSNKRTMRIYYTNREYKRLASINCY